MPQIVISGKMLRQFCSLLEGAFMDCMDDKPVNGFDFYFNRFMNQYYAGFIFKVVKHPLTSDSGFTFPQRCKKLCQSYIHGEHSYTDTVTLFRKTFKDFLTADAKELIPECDDYFMEEDE